MCEIHHDADRAGWAPKVARRLYACSECGTEQVMTTNHSGTVWAAECAGKCRDIINPHTAREVVLWHPARPHKFIREV
jgi:hypothetical protein